MSKKYLLPCRCGRETPVDVTQAGARVRCPCGAELDVPTMLGLAKLLPVDESANAPLVARRGWNLRHRLVLIGGVVCLVGLAGVAGFWLFRPKAIDVSRFSPAQSLGLWNLLREGIANPQTFGEERLDSALQQNTQWLVVSAVVAVLGVLIAASAFFVGGKQVAETGER